MGVLLLGAFIVLCFSDVIVVLIIVLKPPWGPPWENARLSIN